MARARNIKPGFFRNEILGTIDPYISLLFAGLWTLADRDGILEDRPMRIKADIFPYRDSLDVNGYLTELATLGFIHRYQAEGLALIKIDKFEEHQSPHHTEKASIYPDYSESCKLTVNPPLLDGGNPPDSLIPDSLIPDIPAAKAARVSGKSVTLKNWLETVKQEGEKPIADYKTLWEYCETIGLPRDWIIMQWMVFVEKYRDNPNSNKKRYIDWRITFLNSVKENWYGLWFFKDDQLSLSTKGQQLNRATKETA